MRENVVKSLKISTVFNIFQFHYCIIVLSPALKNDTCITKVVARVSQKSPVFAKNSLHLLGPLLCELSVELGEYCGGVMRVPAVGQHLGSVSPHGHHMTEGGAGRGGGGAGG